MRIACAIGVVLAVGMPAVVASQSLGDAARKEKERRQKVAQPGKAFTDADLPDRPPAKGQDQAKNPPGGDDQGLAAPGESAPLSSPPEGHGQSEASWRSRAEGARARVQSAQTLVDTLEKSGRGAGLTVPKPCKNAFGQPIAGTGECYETQGTDPLTAARNELDAARKALDALEEDARRAGVPAGWVR